MPKYKVEIKNIGSISVLEKVIDSEYARQAVLLDNGEMPPQETRGLVDMTGKTQSQRSKGDSADYRYFPEPDIPPIHLTDEYLETLKKTLPELPLDKKLRLKTETGLHDEVLDIFVNDKRLLVAAEKIGTNPELQAEIIKWITGDYAAYINTTEPHESFEPTYIVSIIKLLQAQKITRDGAKQLLAASLQTGKDPETLATEMNLSIVTDAGAIDEAIKKVMAANEKAVADYKSGKNPNAVMFLVGQVMKEMRGRANAAETEKKIRELLEN